ncbi:sugar transferase [Kitasatospora sp. NBC_00240]|uniref:sugar transferase n=1 Tax=Kitasatospora sp. NBC_00240 TaxID=2903567 RepID=UPI00224F7458|nr:sugar transferase [Kitasatospora sp. NBC_00240]MCX5214018.1 sugar transferase [Kitasatospora sp. NBC_00240]
MKRAGDLAITALAGVTAIPLGLLIAVLIRCTTGGPVLVRRAGSGRHGRPFEILTFRTTREARVQDGPAARTTRLGALLRRTGLEQLPQLWNVVRGEMAVVGPRPGPPEQAPQHAPHRSGRLAVRPGLTGWAQVGGRTGISRSQRLERDLWYVEHRSLRLDLRILALTVKLLLRPGGGPVSGAAVPAAPAPQAAVRSEESARPRS